MAELRKKYLFRKGHQKTLFDHLVKKVPVRKMASMCRVSERTIRDWKREKFNADQQCVELVCNAVNIPIPKNVSVLEQYWHCSSAASKGGKAVMSKYGHVGGNAENRRQKWDAWWARIGQFKTVHNKHCIRRAPLSKKLAEFVGIMLGDGCISKRQVMVILHRIDDHQYSIFVSTLIKQLFDVPVARTMRAKNNVAILTVSRTSLVELLRDHICLWQGDKVKGRVSIPPWILDNKQFMRSCIRGLFDTDGTVYTHQYLSKGKKYAYKKLGFSSANHTLLRALHQALNELGYTPYMVLHKRGGGQVRLESHRLPQP